MKEIIFLVLGIMIVLGLLKKMFKLVKWVIIIAIALAAYKYFLPLF